MNKVWIITEGNDNIIRAVVNTRETAVFIVKSFPFLNLKMTEHEVM